MLKQITGLVAAASFSALASASMITDVVTQNEYVGWFGSHSYAHDLNDDGFSLGSAVSGTLEIALFDDNEPDACEPNPLPFGPSEICIPDIQEIVVFTVEAFDLDTGGFTFGSSFSGDLEVNALAALNADGMLDVTVSSVTGDFYVGNSTLKIVTSAVPEPGVIGLLALGLLGLRVARPKAA